MDSVMGNKLICKNCRAPITATTTFCRTCNTSFPEAIEVEEDYDLPPLPAHLRKKLDSEAKEKAAEEEAPTPEPEITEPKEPVILPTELDKKAAPVPKLKSTSGEYSVFKNPNLADSSDALPSEHSEKQNISSAQLIAAVAKRSRRSREEVAGVMDGFWDYVAEVKNHYSEHSQCHSLVVPHFGTFRYRCKWRESGEHARKLTFHAATTPSAKARRRTYDSSWADQWNGKLDDLSVRRRISVYVSERSGLPLRTNDEILNLLLLTTRELCECGHVIHWAHRGTMKQDGAKDGYSFSASKGFLKRLDAPAPTRPKRPNHRTGSREQAEGESEGKGVCGCLVIGFIVFLLIKACS